MLRNADNDPLLAQVIGLLAAGGLLLLWVACRVDSYLNALGPTKGTS